mmetsp:Transcript_13049/g.28777  ORF Transcript_13049/g.28777 Transcript_13049/m.28777 type:complete len:309 (+) Transcript_13049:44-970(+)
MGAEEIIKRAISAGVPAYNAGQISICFQIYEAAAAQLLKRCRPELLTDVEQDLELMVLEAQSLPERQGGRGSGVDQLAWSFRGAFDKQLGMVSARKSCQDLEQLISTTLSGVSVKRVATTDLDSISYNVIHDFRTGEGMPVCHSVVNDTVMGGRSDSQARLSSGGALFQGTVTTIGGGGFVSVRFDLPDPSSLVSMLRKCRGVAIKVQHFRGCKSWKFQLSEGYNAKVWQAPFTATDDGEVIRIPRREFVSTWRGRSQGNEKLTDEALSSIRGFGFMLSFLNPDGSNNPHFVEGPFEMNILRVEGYSG